MFNIANTLFLMAYSTSHRLHIRFIRQDTFRIRLRPCINVLNENGSSQKKDLLVQPKDMGTVYYKARDRFSIYSEHEVCDVVICTTKILPPIVEEVSYGYLLLEKKDLSSPRIAPLLAPWVVAMIKEKLL